MVCILWFSRGLGTVPPWQRYIRGWLIYLLCLVFQLSRWLMCFGYRTYSKSLNLELMRLSRRRRPRRRERKIEKTKTNKMNCLLNTRLCYSRLHLSSVSSSKGKPLTLQLLRSLFTALNNIIAARADHLHYGAYVRFILLRGRCSSSCDDLWSLEMKWKTLESRREFWQNRWREKLVRETLSQVTAGGADRDEKRRLLQVHTNTQTSHAKQFVERSL